MVHPLQLALAEVGWSKDQLAAKVRSLRLRRNNGRRLHLSVNYINQILRGDRTPHRLMSDAIASALGKDETFAVSLERWRPSADEREKAAG